MSTARKQEVQLVQPWGGVQKSTGKGTEVGVTVQWHAEALDLMPPHQFFKK